MLRQLDALTRLRRRVRLWTGSIVILGAAVTIVFIWVREHALEIAGAAAFLAVLFAIARAPATPAPTSVAPRTTPIAELTEGVPASTAGLVQAPPSRVPFFPFACAWLDVDVVDADTGESVLAYRSADRLELGDGDGAVIAVDLTLARWHEPRVKVVESTGDAPDEALLAFLRDRGVAPRPHLRATLRWIGPRELVFARGTPRAQPAQPGIQYRKSERRELELTGDVVLSLTPLGAGLG
jgi:hypothetical protein